MRLTWAADIQLNFVTTMGHRRFLEPAGERADVLVVAGDIAESQNLVSALESLARLEDIYMSSPAISHTPGGSPTLDRGLWQRMLEATV